jgi:uncharacterized protein (TIGR00252 family)
MTTTAVGHQGEQLAAEWLVRHGYSVIERNWKSRWCEIDIVAMKNGIVYFVEVKYRKNTAYGDGFEYVTIAKLRKMQFAAEFWIKMKAYEGDCQLAAASVDGTTGDVEFTEV